MKSEGHRVPMLDNEPSVTIYESFIIQTAQKMETAADIIAWGNIHMISDLPEFVDLVLYCRNRMEQNARN